MKTTFKKSLIAVALTSVSAGAFAAADVTGTTPVAMSIEGAAVEVTLPSVEVVLGAEYAVGDVITLNFTGGALKPASLAASLNANPGTDVNDTMTLGLLQADENKAIYRVTELTYDGAATETTVGTVITIDGIASAGLKFVGSSVLAAGGVTYSFSAVTNNNQPIDTTGSKLSKKVIYTGEEFMASVATKANAIIDVESDRKLFAPDAVDTIVFDTAVIAGVDTTGDNLVDTTYIPATTATLTKISYTVNSDFSWVEDDDANTAGIQPVAGTVAVSNCVGLAGLKVTADAVTWSCTAGAANTTLTLDPKQGGAEFPASLTPKTFSTDVKFDYNNAAATATSETAGGLNSGSWTLNGSQVRVPYMVVQNGRFGAILNIANHGSKDGDITLDVFAEDGTVLASNYAAGVSKAGSVTNVAQAARNALTAAGKNLNNVTKFSVQITTNVPEDDVIVYAAYTDANNGGERAIVNNDSKVQTK